MTTLEQKFQEYKAVLTEKDHLKTTYLNEWDNLEGERKARLLDGIQAANQSIAKIRLELLNRRVKINRVMPFSHFFYIDTEGIIEDIEGNRILFRAEGMSKENGRAWLSMLCLNFAEEETK